MKTSQYTVQLNSKKLFADQKNMITFHDKKNIQIPDIPSRKYSCIEKDNDDYGFAVPYDENKLMRIKTETPPIMFFYETAEVYEGNDYENESEDDSLIISCKTQKDFFLNGVEKLNNNQAKWVKTLESFDKRMYCSPGLENRILQVETTGDSAILRLYKINSITKQEKTNRTFGDKISKELPSLPNISYSNDNILKNLSEQFSNFELFYQESYEEFQKRLVFDHTQIEDQPYPHIPKKIYSIVGKDEILDNKKDLLFYDDFCQFCCVINSPKTKETFFIPWNSEKIIKIIPRSEYHPIISTFELNFPPNILLEGLFSDALYCKKNDSIYCIPWASDFILQIIPSKEKTNFKLIKSEFLDIGKSKKYSSGVVGYDQNIYCIPFNEKSVLQIKIVSTNPYDDPEFFKLDLKSSTFKI